MILVVIGIDGRTLSLMKWAASSSAGIFWKVIGDERCSQRNRSYSDRKAGKTLPDRPDACRNSPLSCSRSPALKVKFQKSENKTSSAVMINSNCMSGRETH